MYHATLLLLVIVIITVLIINTGQVVVVSIILIVVVVFIVRHDLGVSQITLAQNEKIVQQLINKSLIQIYLFIIIPGFFLVWQKITPSWKKNLTKQVSNFKNNRNDFYHSPPLFFDVIVIIVVIIFVIVNTEQVFSKPLIVAVVIIFIVPHALNKCQRNRVKPKHWFKN